MINKIKDDNTSSEEVQIIDEKVNTVTKPLWMP